jgi:hypothetical protein
VLYGAYIRSTLLKKLESSLPETAYDEYQGGIWQSPCQVDFSLDQLTVRVLVGSSAATLDF